MPGSDVTIVGGTVAALAAALAAARRHRRVTLCIDPARIGGSFAGIADGQRRFDLGVRLLELDYEGSAPCPMSAFDSVRGTHRPVIQAVGAFIRGILGDALRPAAEPQTWIGGRRIRCPLLTVDLAELPGALPAEDRRRILGERRTDAAVGATLEDASLAQHGPCLHAWLIAPLCAKQHPAWSAIPAADRRKLWAALFHPTTVSQAFGGGPIAFRPHRPVATTGTHQAHPFVAGLMQAITAEPRIAVHPTGPLTGLSPAGGGAVTLRFAGRAIEVPAEAYAIGTPPDQAFRAAGLSWHPDRLQVSITWLDVPDAAVRHVPSSLMLVDPGAHGLRVSYAGSSEGRTTFAIEFGAVRPSETAARRILRDTGLVTEDATPRTAHALSAPGPPVPSVANGAAFRAAAARLADTRVHLLAGARRFGFDSLNDQLADGLHFGECRC